LNKRLFSSKSRIVLSRIIIAILALYILFNQPPDCIPAAILDLSEMIGFMLLVMAAFGRMWCLLFVGGKKNDILMTSGPYSIVRNPLYVFSFLGAVGLGMTVKNPLLALALAAAFIAYYPFVVKKEEQKLAILFGDEYREYLSRTPRWFPNFGLYSEPDTMMIHTVYIRNGILSGMWFIWAFLLWELLEYIRSTGLLNYGT